MVTAGPRVGAQRGVALAVLVAAGLLSLPVVAAVLDGPSTEQLIVPAQVALMAAVGAVVGHRLPGVAGAGSTGARGAWVGALIGVTAALVGVALFSFALNGIFGP